MIPIHLDISNTVEEFLMNEQEQDSLVSFVLQSITSEYMEEWENQVNETLGSTRSVYKQSMDYSFEGKNSVVFILSGKDDGQLAVMLEEGSAPFDIKDGFSASPKRKHKKDGGWYMVVPFRMATSEALAESSIFAGKMPKPLENIVKKQEVLTVKNIPSEFQMKGVREEFTFKGKTYPEYKHKSSKFEGVKHQTKKQHGQYVKFRIASSDKHQTYAWMHPGFKPYKIMDKTLQSMRIDKAFTNAIDDFLRSY